MWWLAAVALCLLAKAGSSAALQVEAEAPWNLARLDSPTPPGTANSTYSYAADGTGITVFLVTTGVNAAHDEFAAAAGAPARVVTTSTYTTVVGEPADSAAVDCTGLNTQIASIIGGRTYGVAKKVTIHAVKFAACSQQPTTSQLVAALAWVLQSARPPAVVMVAATVPANATGVSGALQQLLDAGLTVIAPAGMTGSDACSGLPAGLAGVVAVGMSTRSNAVDVASNQGPCITLFAPGRNITGAAGNSTTGTLTASGTNQAAAHAAGAAAHFLQRYPDATPAQVVQHLVTTAAAGALANASGSANRLLQVDLQLEPQAPLSAAQPFLNISFVLTGVPLVNVTRTGLSVALANATGAPLTDIYVLNISYAGSLAVGARRRLQAELPPLQVHAAIAGPDAASAQVAQSSPAGTPLQTALQQELGAGAALQLTMLQAVLQEPLPGHQAVGASTARIAVPLAVVGSVAVLAIAIAIALLHRRSAQERMQRPPPQGLLPSMAPASSMGSTASVTLIQSLSGHSGSTNSKALSSGNLLAKKVSFAPTPSALSSASGLSASPLAAPREAAGQLQRAGSSPTRLPPMHPRRDGAGAVRQLPARRSLAPTFGGIGKQQSAPELPLPAVCGLDSGLAGSGVGASPFMRVGRGGKLGRFSPLGKAASSPPALPGVQEVVDGHREDSLSVC